MRLRTTTRAQAGAPLHASPWAGRRTAPRRIPTERISTAAPAPAHRRTPARSRRSQGSDTPNACAPSVRRVRRGQTRPARGAMRGAPVRATAAHHGLSGTARVRHARQGCLMTPIQACPSTPAPRGAGSPIRGCTASGAAGGWECARRPLRLAWGPHDAMSCPDAERDEPCPPAAYSLVEDCADAAASEPPIIVMRAALLHSSSIRCCHMGQVTEDIQRR